MQATALVREPARIGKNIEPNQRDASCPVASKKIFSFRSEANQQ
jgi:hypothetical protein